MAAKPLLCLVFVLVSTYTAQGQDDGVIDGSSVYGWIKPSAWRRHHGRALAQTDRYTKPYKICTSEWTPMVTCSAEEDPSTYSGFQVELFREVAHHLGWPDEDYYFACEDWTPMIDDLLSPNGTCTMAAAGAHTWPETTPCMRIPPGSTICLQGALEAAVTCAFIRFSWP